MNQRAVAAVQNGDIRQDRPNHRDWCGRANRIDLRDRDDFVGLRSFFLTAIGWRAILAARVVPVLAASHLSRLGAHRALGTRGPCGHTQANQDEGRDEASEGAPHETIVRCPIDGVKRGLTKLVARRSQINGAFDVDRLPQPSRSRSASDGA